MTDIDPIIRRVSEAYGFTIEWCDVLEKTIIKGEEEGCYFFWDSTYPYPVGAFFLEVRDYFINIGKQTAGYWN
jgi:hypothetical protein